MDLPSSFAAQLALTKVLLLVVTVKFILLGAATTVTKLSSQAGVRSLFLMFSLVVCVCVC